MAERDAAIVISEGAGGGFRILFAEAPFAERLGQPLPDALAESGDERAGIEAALAVAHPIFVPVARAHAAPLVLAGVPLPPGADAPAAWVVCIAPDRPRDADFVDTLALSLVLYDADDRLAWYNRTYREVLGPNAHLLVPGRRFEEIMSAAYRAGHAGGAGDIEARIAERLARHRAHAPFEEELSGGRWLLTREIALAGGGILGVRSDITAEKRGHRRQC